MSDRNVIVSNTIWKLLERIIAQGISLIVSILIARILSPTDYSVVSLVAIFFAFANVLISGGLNTALIQKKDADMYDYSTVLHVSVILSVAIYLVLFFTAPLIANLYKQESLTLIIRIMAISLPITAVKSIWCAYISSQMQFKKFFFATLGGTIVSGVVGIWMALKGFGAWALVAQQMTNIAIDTIILILFTRIRIVFKISFSRLKVLFKYGWKVFVSSLLGTTYSEVSPLVIGLKFSVDELSFYSKGRSFPSMLSTTCTSTLSAVLFPFLAKYQDDKEQILNYTRKFMQLSSFIIFPVMLGFFAVAENFVYVILTEKWLLSVFYIQVFCIVYMFDVVAIGNCETIKAIGRSDVYLIIEIIKKTCYAITLALFIIFANSPSVLVLAYLICMIVQVVVNSIPNIKLINYKLIDQIKDLFPNLLISIIMCVAVMFLGRLSMDRTKLLALQVFYGVLIFYLLCLVTKNKSFAYCVNFIKERFQKKNEHNRV